jgi:hypothetical protein
MRPSANAAGVNVGIGPSEEDTLPARCSGGGPSDNRLAPGYHHAVRCDEHRHPALVWHPIEIRLEALGVGGASTTPDGALRSALYLLACARPVST